MQTIYVFADGQSSAAAANVKLKPVRVRLGVTDGIFTEVLDGIEENDVVVTGSNTPAPTPAAGGARNPFGGSGGGGFRGR